MKQNKFIGGIIFLVVVAVFLVSGFLAYGKGLDYRKESRKNSVNEQTEMKNPVFDPAAKAYYPAVVKVSRKDYRMWYGSSAGIGYAISSDGIVWTGMKNPVNGLIANASHPVVVYDKKGFGNSDYKYKMWYWTGGVDSIEAIKYAESKNGLVWENDQPIQQHLSNKDLQLIAGYNIFDNYFYHIYGPAFVIYNSRAENIGSATQDDKTDDEPMTYSYIMYYDTASESFSSGGSIEQLALAYSVDGVYWIRYGDEPVLIPSGNTSDWDGKYITRGTIIQYSNKSYGFWYSGGQNDSNDGIGYASSSDGLIWTKDSDNPIMHQDDGVAWRSERTYTPMVIKDGRNYKMWFSGKDATGNYAIGYLENVRKK